MRKVMIIAVALVVTGLAYWGYLQISGSATMDPPSAGSGPVPDLPESTSDAQRIEDTLIHKAEHSYYITRDPVTRQVKRVFGFLRLKNPGSQSARWQVEKPYILFYESAYKCRIDADQGLIQTEGGRGNLTPKDGQLEGNVVIRIQPSPGSRMAETTILMDDVLFSSERTEFSTDGPVRVTSSQVELTGRGMVLLVNAVDGQVEYLHILDLVSLRLKDFAKSQGLNTGTDSSPSAPSAQSALENGSQTAVGLHPDDGAEDSEPRRLYQCVIEDNVKIHYGDQIVVAGAEHVNIQNILMSRRQAESPLPEAAPTSAATEDAGAASIEAIKADVAADMPDTSDAAAASEADDRRDVVVTCDGGIIVKPVDNPAAAAANPSIAMGGAPLRIEQIDPLAPEKMTPLAHCGLLEYDMATEVLRLNTTADSGEILLGGGSDGRIQTQGPVVWDRKAKQAQVVGPGTVFLDDQGASTDTGQVAFTGLMELFFADAPAAGASLQLAAANLTGGMSAELGGNDAMMTAAETAYLTFGPQNALTSARLEGAVRFQSDEGTSSNATAQTAVFHFDDNRHLARADLAGDVQMTTDGTHLHTDKAVIDFAADKDGAIQASQFSTVTNATLETENAASQIPTTRFEARNISYDILTGSGRAAGPVRFVFYQAADPNDRLLDEYWPVEVNADGDAEFVAGKDGKIDTVTFKQNVSGVQTLNYAGYTESNAFYAETMIVKLGRNAKGAMDIASITLRDGDVYAESKRTQDSRRLAMTRIDCRQILYDRQNERLIATGPGNIEMDNSKAEPKAKTEAQGLDLEGPCYAKITGFDRIEWSLANRHLAADAGDGLLQMDYIPLVDGSPSQLIRGFAGRFDAEFATDAAGNTQLNRLVATDHVSFEAYTAQNKLEHTLEGYRLVYDTAHNGWLSITGTEGRPCMADGARVPYIHYNVITEALVTKLSTVPGAVTIPK